jgi:hypothetical protein
VLNQHERVVKDKSSVCDLAQREYAIEEQPVLDCFGHGLCVRVLLMLLHIKKAKIQTLTFMPGSFAIK